MDYLGNFAVIFACMLSTKILFLCLGLDDDSWKNLVENPDKWWDNRTNKVALDLIQFFYSFFR